MKLGTRLVEAGLISPEELAKALEEQEKYGGRLGEILQAITHVRALDYYQSLAKHLSMDFVNLLDNEVNSSLLKADERALYLEHLVIPIAQNEHLILATADPGPETQAFVETYWGKNCKIVATSKFDILWTLQKVFDDQYINESVNDLFAKTPHLSGSKVLTLGQKIFFLILLFAGILTGLYSMHLLLLIFSAVITIGLCGTLVYKLILTVIGLALPHYHKAELLKIDARTLPVYSLLVPLYQENEIILTHLIHKLSQLDYPHHLLDIKLILEKDDQETIEILKKMSLPNNYEFIYVPFGGPRTKPKACNYALNFARGEYVALFDVEDSPEPDQLKKVVATFRKSDEQLVCVQCRLSYYNIKENWLTRLFTLEYSYWFDLLLPTMSFLHLPVPLGGTSNHLRTSVIRKISAWDPFNVTEDAELGLRLHRLGLKTKVIDSVTYEESPVQVRNWFKQRARWIKGYMLTYLVHMRRPFKTLRIMGPYGFLSLQFLIGGTPLSNLMNVVVWAIFAITLLMGPDATNYMFPEPLYSVAMFNLIVGTIVIIILNMLAIIRRGWYGMSLFSIISPLYWLLMSFASYRALYQLITKPSQWDKTKHGVSRYLANPDI